MSITKLDTLGTREEFLDSAGRKKINEVVDAVNAGTTGFSGEIVFDDNDETEHTLTFVNGVLTAYENDDE